MSKAPAMSKLAAIKSALFIPANRNDFVAKAHTRAADAIILDLEDSVVDECKQGARDNIASASAILAQQNLGVMVRINSNLDHVSADLQASVGVNVDCIVIPKAESAKHIQKIAEAISAIESSKNLDLGKTKLLAFIESPTGLQHAHEIAASSERMFALTLGTEDFSAAMNSVPEPDILFYPFQQIALAARAAGIEPLGFNCSIAEFSDLELLRKAVQQARRMGFRGACCIHPKQVNVLNQEFSPATEELEHAERVVACFEEALKQGIGAVAYKGEMIDLPVYERAKITLLQR